MKTKRLGNSDLSITPVGFGAWAIGGSGWEFGWGEQDDKASVAAIHRALELGVNWIDTAAVYGMGHSEEIVAVALRTWPGPRPYVFTKCGLRWDEQGYIHRSLTADSIRRECEDSLRRLNVDVIDLYQIHWPTEDLEEGWGCDGPAAKRRKGPMDRRIQLQGRGNAPGGGDRSHHFFAASVFLSSARSRTRDPALLPIERTWRDCLFANGLRVVNRRDDARTSGKSAGQRLAKSRHRVSGAEAFEKSRTG